MNSISVISKATGAATSVNTNSVNLNGSSVVVLHAQKEDVAALTRIDNDLVITLKSGEKVTITNFFVADEKGVSQLVLEDSQGALWWLEEPSTGIHFEPISSIEDLVAGAETSDHVGGAIWPWVLGGIAAVGGGVALAASGGGGGGGGGGGNSSDSSDSNDGRSVPPNNDEETRDTTPPDAPGNLTISDDGKTVSGTAEPGSSVTIRDADGNVIGVGTAGDDGKFAIDLDTPKTNGETLTADATDTAGNTGPSATLVVPDITPPPAPIITHIVDGVSPITGTVGDSQSTNDTTPTINGTGEAGAVVTVYADGASLGSTTVAADGSWSFIPSSPLPDGAHTFTATATDPAGNASLFSAPTMIIVDTIAPTLTNLKVSGDGITATGESEPYSTVTIKDANGNEIGSATADKNGDFSATLTSTFTSGETLVFTATDAAGNTGPSATIQAPSPQQIAAPEMPTLFDNVGIFTGPLENGDKTDDSHPTISGTAESGSTITIYDGARVIAITVADGSGHWELTLPNALPDGDRFLSVTATNAAGEISSHSAAIKITVDTVAPDRPTDLVVSIDGTTVTGNAEPNATITIFSAGGGILGVGTADGDGAFSIGITPAQTHGEALLAAARDEAGNVGQQASFNATSSGLPDVPTIDVVYDDVAPYTGPIQYGQSTNDTQPMLSGRAEANSTVLIFNNGIFIGATLVSGSGDWSFTPLLPLLEGEQAFTVMAANQNGISASSQPLVITIDIHAPDAPSDLAVLPDGTAVTGHAEPGSTVTITDSKGNPLGSATTDKNGDFTVQLSTPQTNGETLTATATDPAHNDSQPATVQAKDTTPPDAPTDLAVINNGATVTGNAEPGSTVTITDSKGNPLGSDIAGEDGGFTVQLSTPQTNGETLTAVATDPAHNDSPPATVQAKDTTPPNAPTDLAVVDSGTAVTGHAEPGSTVTITDSKGNPLGSDTADKNGDFTVQLSTPQTNGETLTAVATDPAHNDSLPATVKAIDTTLPAAPTIDTMTDDAGKETGVSSSAQTTGDSTPTLKGTAEANGTVTVYDSGTSIGSTTADENGDWTFTPTKALDEGDHSLTASVTDAAGNKGPDSSPVAIVVDTIAPDAPVIVSLTNDADETIGATTNDLRPTINGTGEIGATVTVFLDGGKIGTAKVGSDGAWRFTLDDDLSVSSHTFKATATDAAGNVSLYSNPVTVGIDLTPPSTPTIAEVYDNAGADTGALAPDETTDDSRPTFSGAGETGSVITLYDGNKPIGTATVENGVWSIRPSAGLGDGPHSVTVIATDAAGNKSEASNAVTFTVDTTAPNPPAVTEINDSVGIFTGPLKDGQSTDDTRPTVSGTAEAGSTITIYVNDVSQGTVTADEFGAWNWRPAAGAPLKEGDNRLSFTATDAVGNVGERSADKTIVVDTTPPKEPADIAVSDNGTTVTGTADPGSTVVVRDDKGNALGSGPVDSGGSFSVNITPAQTGGETLVVLARDDAGNFSNGVSITAPTTGLPDVPEITDIIDSVGSYKGSLTDGQHTDDPLPELHGKGEAGSTVTLYDNGKLVDTALVTDEGEWTIILTNELLDGPHAFTVSATNANGTGGTSAPITITVDTVAPDAPSITDAVGGSVTSDTTPTLNGKAEAGATVTLYDGEGNPVGTAKADDGGNWTITPDAPLGEGEHQLTAVATDAAGNTGAASAPFSLTVDTKAPDAPSITGAFDNVSPVTGPVLAGKTTNDTTPTLSGKAEAGATVTLYDGTNNPIGSAKADGAGDWSITPDKPLGEGAHSLTAIATDAAGNIGQASASFSLTVDTIAPAAPTITGAVGGETTSNTTPTLSGKAEPDATVTIYDGEGNPIGSVTADGGGNWTFTLGTPLGEGKHALTAVATDAAGNTGEASAAFNLTIDTKAPDAPFITGALDHVSPVTGPVLAGKATNDTAPTLSGKAEAGATVTLYDGANNPIGSAKADDAGDWSITPDKPLGEGAHSLTAIATDAAGNIGQASAPFSLTVDTIAPDAPTITSIVDRVSPTTGPIAVGQTTNDPAPTLNGKAEAGAVVTIYDGVNNPIGSATADDGGNWTFTPDKSLGEGEHSLTAVATDAAGNVGIASPITAVTIDTIAPNAPTNVSVSPNGTRVTGSAEPGSTVTITAANGTVLGTATTDGTGSFTATIAPAQTNGQSLLAYAQDKAGNVGESTGFSAPATGLPGVPTIDSIADDVPPIIGSLKNGQSTNDTLPLLSGKATVGTTVTVYDNGSPIGTATVDAGGAWNFTPTTALGEGPHVFTATATNVNGTGGFSAPQSIVVDITRPDAPTATVNADGSAISGSAEAGSTVTITLANGTTVTTTANDSGSYSYTFQSKQTDGEHLSVTATDAAGNASDATRVDAPTLPLSANDNVIELAITSDAAVHTAQYSDYGFLLVGALGNVVSLLGNDTAQVTFTVGSGATADVKIDAGATGIVLSLLSNLGLIVQQYNAANSSWSTVADTQDPRWASLLTFGDSGISLNLDALAAGTYRVVSYNTSLLATGSYTNLNVSVVETGPGTVNGETTHTGNVILDDDPVSGSDTASNGAVVTQVTNASGTVVPVTQSGAVIQGTYGTLTLYPDGSYTYTLFNTSASIVGHKESFSYTLSDGTISDTANLVISLGEGALTGQAVAIDNAASLVFDTEVAAIDNGTWSQAGYTVVSLTLGNALDVGILKNLSKPIVFNVEEGTTRSLTLQSVIGGVAIASKFDLYVYKFNDATQHYDQYKVVEDWLEAPLLGGKSDELDLTLDGGKYLFLLNTASGLNVLAGYTLKVLEDHVYSVTSVGASTAGDVLDNDIAPPNTVVSAVNGVNVAASGNTVIVGQYGTLTINAQGHYTYTLKSGVGADSIHTPDSFIYTITAPNGDKDTASLNITPTPRELNAVDDVSATMTITSAQSTSSYSDTSVGTASWTSALGKTTGSGSGGFVVDEGTVLKNIVLSFKASSTLLLGSTDITWTIWEGTTAISSGKVTASMLLGGSPGTMPINGLELDAGSYTLSFTGSETGLVGKITVTPSVGGTLVHLSDYLSTGSHAVSGNIFDGSDSSGAMDQLSSVGTTLSIKDAHGVATTLNPYTTSNATADIHGQYGTLTIGVDGAYSYSLNAGVSLSSITTKETFEYTLNAANGQTAHATLTIDMAPQFVSSNQNDVITGTAYADTAIYHLLSAASDTGGNGSDVWSNFSLQQGDKIDVHELLVGWNGQASTLGNYLSVTTSGNDTVIAIDRDGAGQTYHSATLITLENVHTTLDELIEQHHIITN